MRFHTAGNLLIGALAAAVLLPAATDARTCLALYQMADNNLEYYLRQDYNELFNSPVIKSDQLRTWIYYDALNQGGQALPNTVYSDGSAVSGTFTGSRYVTYNPGWNKMMVDTELSGEQNSDTQSSVQNFLQKAFSDCLANGYDSLMAVFASHGGGFAGYGGDENGRKLLQTNQGIAAAIRGALAAVGGPDRLEVIGFDACLMQAVGAADDYKGVAQYMLASEAVEPGHGWAYSYLTSANSALELSQQILNTFLSQTQGGSSHQSPKTMALMDTAKFDTFIASFESFAGELLALLKAGDADLHTFVSRSRSASVAFEGIVDAVGSQYPSGLDIGSWLGKFRELCNPGDPLGADMNTAINAYNDMFVATGVGPGTSPGTGMHITWPHQGEFAANQALWNQVLFNNANYVTPIIPNFRAFLQWFLTAGTPAQTGSSICGIGSDPGAAASAAAGNNGQGNPKMIIQSGSNLDAANDRFELTAKINSNVGQMLVEFGLDLSTPLKPFLEEKGYAPLDEDYLILLGGDVAGVYSGSDFTATWDTNFYFLNITGTQTFDALYVFDQGDGSRKIPAMYFPPEREEDLNNLQFLDFLLFDFDYWISQGARYSFLKFSVDEAQGRVNDNLSLFISNEAGVFFEQPRSAGGFMIPLIYVDAFIQGYKLDTLPGGFNSTVIEWNEVLDYNILTTPYENVFNVIPDTDAVVLNMYAFDHSDPNVAPEAEYFDVRRDRGAKPGDLALLGETTGTGTTGGTTAASGAFSVSAGFAFVAALGAFYALV